MYQDKTVFGPGDRGDTLRFLWLRYRVPDTDARDLLDRARENSVSGMAAVPLPDGRQLWVTHMITQGGKFIVEAD